MATNQTSVTVSKNTTYVLPISYATITLVDNIDAQEQLIVFRTNIETLSGLTLSVREYRDFGQVPSSWLTLDPINKTITAITIPASATFTRDSGSTVAYPAMSASEPLVVLRKNIISEPYVEWVTGSRITAEQLNLNTGQLLGLIQELKYATDQNISRIDQDAVLNPAKEDLNLASFKIINLATPSASTDAANKTYVDGVITTNVTNKLGIPFGIATLGSDGLVNPSQLTATTPTSYFYTTPTAPVRAGVNKYNYGSLWYNATNGRLYVYLFDDRYTGSDPNNDGQVGYWVDVSSTTL